MKPRAIDRKVEAKRLIRIHPGIYRVGPMRQALEAEMAAVLAVGPGAVLSHHSAAFLHKLLPYPARDGLVHVTVPGRQAGSKRGVVIHRTRNLLGDESMRLNRIPVTTPARTILDLAATLGRIALEQLIATAHRRRPANTRAVDARIARHPGRPGVPAIRALLAGTPKFTRSRAERRLLTALRRAGFEPETNVRLAGHEVDVLLPGQRLVVEIDGGPFHSTRPDRRRDYARDADLHVLGYSVLRFDADEPTERAIASIARLS